MELRRTLAAGAVRVAAVVAVGTAATAGVTWAASQGVPPTRATPRLAKAAPPAPLVVPDVRRLAFVFAKASLADAGFAWRVRGRVHGFPANTVVSQSPAPGTAVQDVGAPLVTLTLERTRGYPQAGEPEDASPYPGTAPALAGAAKS